MNSDLRTDSEQDPYEQVDYNPEDGSDEYSRTDNTPSRGQEHHQESHSASE